MRKRSKYRPRPLTPPMLVNRGLVEQEIESRERMLVEAFAGGWAAKDHFDNLAEMRNVLVLAAAYKNDASAKAICEGMRVVMGNFRERMSEAGTFAATDDELAFLRVFIDGYRDFWIRQPVTLYLMACDELKRAGELGLLTVGAETTTNEG